MSVHFGSAPPGIEEDSSRSWKLFYVSAIEDSFGKPALRVWRLERGEIFRLDYVDGAQFWLDCTGGAVWSRWPDTLSFDDSVSYFLGPVMGILLRLKGVTCLHASAVECGGRAVAFVGDPEAGKSTTAAAMARNGCAVLADDIVALTERDGSFFIVPAFPYLSLWPDSVGALYGPEKALPAFSETFSKRVLSLAANNLRFAQRPARLDAIFLLGERSPDPMAPFMEHVEKAQALMSLVANTYANLMLTDRMRAREFEFLGRLAAAVPVRRLRAHEDASRIGSLCDLIGHELARLEKAVPHVRASQR